jgi:hypothetical protein
MTQANVESFISQYASRWGSHHITVRMDWGCKRLLTVDVVTLSVRDESSEIGFHYQAVTKDKNAVELVKKRSPPLMIEFFRLPEMRKTYRSYVQDLVQNDLTHYVEIAYDSNSLPQRVLSAVSQWYQMSDESDNEVLCRTPKNLTVNIDAPANLLSVHSFKEQ